MTRCSRPPGKCTLPSAARVASLSSWSRAARSRLEAAPPPPAPPRWESSKSKRAEWVEESRVDQSLADRLER